MQNLAYSYQQMGEAGKKSFKETLAAARENKDAQEDLQMAIQAGTIEGKFQMAARAISEVTQVLAGVKGAMIAMGMSTEDAQESIAKLQGMMAFSQGMAALIGLDGAVKALIPSIGAATAGLNGFKAALASTGIGLAAVAIGYIVMELADMAFGEDEATKAAKAHDEARKKQIETFNDLTRVTDAYFELTQLEAQVQGVSDKKLAENKIKYLQSVYNARQSMDANSHEAVMALYALDAEKARQQIKLNEDAEKAAKDSIARQLAKSKEAFEIEILQLKARGASASELADAEEAFKVRDLSMARSIGAEKDAIRQREVDLEKFKLQRIIDETAWAQEQIKAIMDEGPAVRPKSAAMAQMFGAMNEAQWTNLMRTNRKFFEQMKSQDVSNFKEYIRSFYTQYEAAAKSFDPNTFTDAMMPPDAPEKINIGYKKIMGVDNANHNARVRQQTAQVNAMNQGLQQGLAQGTDAFEQFVSDMVQGDKMAGKNFGNALLGAVAGFMSTLGKAMIAAAVASDTFQKALLTQPAAAIVAGVALVAAAGVVKGLMKKGMGANQGGGGGNNSGGPEGIRRFASGGIISGPTIGMMGEYPGAKSNPEVVAPLDKLKNIIGPSGSQGGELVTRISGQDLLIMLDRAETYRGRVR